MEPTPEKGQAEAKTVHLGEEFTLFDPKRTTKTKGWDPNGPTQFITSIRLDFALLHDLPIEIKAETTRLGREDFLTPFKPELGYQITDADYSASAGIERILTAGHKKGRRRAVDWGWVREVELNAPLQLVMESQGTVLGFLLDHSTASVSQPQADPMGVVFEFETDEVVINTLERLKMQLFFPDGSAYEGKEESLSEGDDKLLFFRFYPLERGPLPLREGFHLCLPSDLELLSQIKSKFILPPKT